MRKPWTEYDRRGRSLKRTIRWGEKRLIGGQWAWKRGRYPCGDDYELYQRKLLEITNLLSSQDTGGVNSGRPIVEVYQAFMADRKANGYPWRTVRGYQSTLPAFISRHPHGTMNAIDPKEIRSYKSDLATKGYAPWTVARRLGDLQTFLGWAKEGGFCDRNAFADLLLEERRPRGRQRQAFIPRPKSQPRFFTDEEILAIERTAVRYPFIFRENSSRGQVQRNRMRELLGLIRLGYMAALRPSEAAKVKAEDILHHKEGGDSVRVISLKGGLARERVVPLRPEILEVLPRVKSGYLFQDWLWKKEGVWHLHDMMLNHYFGCLLKRAGIRGQQATSFYSLRHTFARIFLENGGSMKSLADIMGHGNFNMIMKVYGFLSKEHFRDEVGRIVFPGFAGSLRAIDVI